jgi:hypothetical protein
MVQWLGYGLDARRIWVRFPTWADLSVLHSVQTDSGTYLASYPKGTCSRSSGAWTWPLTSSQYRDKCAELYLHFPTMTWGLIMHRDSSVTIVRHLSSVILEWHDTPMQSKASTSVKVTVTLRLAVYRQSVCLGAEPLETHGQNLSFSIEHAVIVLI